MGRVSGSRRGRSATVDGERRGSTAARDEHGEFEARTARRALRDGARPLRARSLSLALGALLAGSMLTGCDDGSGEGTVVRVIDGDTLVAVVAGEETTIRLLNIDTPETKHPDLPVQCLGPEATDFLTERLPAGTEIELEYDEERLDRYDRTLAGVYESGSLINAEIAAEGLGVPVHFEPNDRFLPEVEEAAATAQSEGLGLFSAATECTVPAQVETLGAAVDEIPTTVTGDPAQALADATTLVEDAEALVDALDADALATGTNAVLALPLAAPWVEERREAAEEVRIRAVEGQERVQGLKDDWDEEQERLREQKEREERERQERERIEREEQERQEREEQERREREAAPAADSSDEETVSGATSSGSGSGSGTDGKSGSGGGSSSSGGSNSGGGNSGGGASGGDSSGGGSSGSGKSGGGKSGCEPYGPEIPYSDDGGYTGKRYGMPGGKTFRKCS
ncbi:thermonuclease family protein [Brachybacterium paraconglomeratum]|uniref:thermonuclease family protein n=1 Tax=Brachybacterium paraconglomeratum TaxID=173362 RepID=UPI00223B72CE|nr:thermonuclease family protein [Brachybacterium paraconglomeratum]MCT1438771.1 thermonuclease family protein [Brachybacterium paraconglomeratum]